MSENIDAEFKKQLKEVVVSKDVQSRMKSIGGWGIFLAIYGFLLTLILFYMSYRQYSSISELERMYSSFGDMGGGFQDSMMDSAIYRIKISATITLFLGILMALPGIFLIRYNSFARRSFADNDQEYFNDSLKSLRNAFIFAAIYAILTIVAFGVLLLGVGRFML